MSWQSLVRKRSFLAALAALLAVVGVWGVVMAQAAQPETLDQRVNDVASQLQCPVCNGESVADSPSTLAVQMRAVIRDHLRHGESEQQVVQHFVDSYGEGIRQEPPMSGLTLVMWLGPLAMLLVGLCVVGSVAQQWRQTAAKAPPADPEAAEMSDADLEAYRPLLEAELRDLTPQPPAPRRKVETGSPPSRPAVSSSMPTSPSRRSGEGPGERSPLRWEAR